MKRTLTITTIMLIFLTALLVVPRPAQGKSPDECRKILKEAVDRGKPVGSLDIDELKYLLLSIPVKSNVPYLYQVFENSGNPRHRMRAFFTLCVVDGEKIKSMMEKDYSCRGVPPGAALYYMARADRKRFGDLVRNHFAHHQSGGLYGTCIPQSCRALAVMDDRKSTDALKEYFCKVKQDGKYKGNKNNARAVLESLGYCAQRLKGSDDCQDILQEMIKSDDPKTAIWSSALLYKYDEKREAKESLKKLDSSVSLKKFPDKYRLYRWIRRYLDDDLGLWLYSIALDNPDLPGPLGPPAKKGKAPNLGSFIYPLAREHYKGLQEYLTNLREKKAPGYEHACLLLSLNYNDRRVRKTVLESYKTPALWTSGMTRQRQDLALAYLVLAEKRDELLFKQLSEGANPKMRAYGCQGLRAINARGKKKEMKSIYWNTKAATMDEARVKFQAARALYRFGVRHFLVEMLKSKEISDKFKATALRSFAFDGDQDDLEIFKDLFDDLPKSAVIREAYIDGLTALAVQTSPLLRAQNQGRREEPLRDCLALMTKCINSTDPDFRVQAARKISRYNYHWQSTRLLKDCVQSSDPMVKVYGILSFIDVTDPITIRKAKAAVARNFTDSDLDVRAAAAALYTVLDLRWEEQFDPVFRWEEGPNGPTAKLIFKDRDLAPTGEN